MTPIVFWFEFASTYSWLAAERVDAVAGAAGFAVEWRPFLLGPLFKMQGLNDSPFNVFPIKGKYMWRDLERQAAALGRKLLHPTIFPQNGLRAARIATAAAGEPWLRDFVRGVYRAQFERNAMIDDHDILRELLAEAGQGPRWLATADTQPVKDALRHATDQATELGLFGAPVFQVGDELFWGNDRLEQALAWARQGRL